MRRSEGYLVKLPTKVDEIFRTIGIYDGDSDHQADRGIPGRIFTESGLYSVDAVPTAVSRRRLPKP